MFLKIKEQEDILFSVLIPVIKRTLVCKYTQYYALVTCYTYHMVMPTIKALVATHCQVQ